MAGQGQVLEINVKVQAKYCTSLTESTGAGCPVQVVHVERGSTW